MKYLLDFDGVLFDIELFKARMEELGFKNAKRSAALFDQMKEKDPVLDVSSFLFPDAKSFLEEHRDDCLVISSFVSSNPQPEEYETDARAYQERKITLSGVPTLLSDGSILVVGSSKEEALKKVYEKCGKDGEDCIFIDDREVHIDEAARVGIKAVCMDRIGTSHDPHVRVVRSFYELADLLQNGV